MHKIPNDVKIIFSPDPATRILYTIYYPEDKQEFLRLAQENPHSSATDEHGFPVAVKAALYTRDIPFLKTIYSYFHPNTTDSYRGWTPLMMSLYNPNPDVFYMTLEQTNQIFLNHCDNCGWNVAKHAIMTGRSDAVHILSTRGLTPQQQCEWEPDPMYHLLYHRFHDRRTR